ncbi:MAG: hypothetical protein OJF59_002160 [Cytophagales bacterium]|jgi:PAS domain S-box-containing protein|nr:MAG: hypothetical protein OJF59_002160 [Cytophagales bacterium]
MIKSGWFLLELFADSKTIVLITDDQFNIRYSSTTSESILGYPSVGILGKNIFDFVPPANRKTWRNSLLKAGSNKNASIEIDSNLGKKISFNVSVTNKIGDEEIQGLVILLHDVTDQKQKYSELKKKNDHLEQFIYKAFHDLRSPVHSAIGLLGLLKNANETEQKNYLHKAEKKLLKLENLINDVCKFYQVDKMAVLLQSVDIKNLIDEEIELIKDINRPVCFQLDFKTSAPLFSDAFRLKTIVGNLISNAVKYSDLKKEKSLIKINTEVTEDQLIISIADNGIGISKDSIGQIFNLFYRATSSSSGSGLGLYIVKDTIERLGGTINVKSQAGVGTEFIVTLPNQQTQAAEVRPVLDTVISC